MLMTHIPYLSLLIWLPILSAIPIAIFNGQNRVKVSLWIALLITVVCLALSVYLYVIFDTTNGLMQFTEQYAWIPLLKINYSVGVDGISLPLITLSNFTTLVIVLAAWNMVEKRVAAYLAAFMVMQGTVVGVFASLDAMLFYFFWEAMLIPMYLSIGIWGMKNRIYASTKFFLYTFFGSALMLAVLIYLRMEAGSFDIQSFYQLQIPLSTQIWIFFGFFLAFAIKIPMWPLHTWLPDAHTEAPTGGSVILAALMLKMGGYGFLRFSLPIVPDACQSLDWFMIALSLFAIVYIGFIAIVQKDMKKLIAYSSVAHMGFVTLGSFMIYVIIKHTGSTAEAYMSLEGAMVQMISHAFGSGAMFLAFGVIYLQIHTRNIKDFGGIAKVMPVFTGFFVLYCMSNVGLPGTSGFVGEFMIILSTFKATFWATCLAALTLIVGAVYTLRMVNRVYYGPILTDAVRGLKDITWLTKFIFMLLTIAIIVIGVYPEILLREFHSSIKHLLDLSLQSRLP
jgi:NADH-quinone oxidoreductase subunit M